MSEWQNPINSPAKIWLSMRGSGVLMSSLVLGHLIIQHLLNDVHDLRLEWVAERWNKVGWRLWDGLMMILAVGHGLNGTNHVIDDYIRDPSLNRAARRGVQLLGALVIMVGVMGLVSFDKEATLDRAG
jgi:succinate dehydrogenase / fumarate reductase membrane anchor subunit